MICIIRSLFFTRRDGETEVGSKATEVPMAQGETQVQHRTAIPSAGVA